MAKRENGSQLFWFLVLACGLSWAVEIPLALQAQGIIREVMPYAFHYLAGYGPLTAALIMTGAISGKEGLRDLWKRITHWRMRAGWWLVAISPFILYLFVSAVLWLIQGQDINFSALGEVAFLPPLGLVVIPFWFLTFGVGEETGWRGFALPRLQKGRSALAAAVLLWLVWAFWHLPLFFYAYDPAIIPGMLLGLLAGSIVFTWLYNSTGGSVLATAIWHALFNTTTACMSCKTGATAAIISALVMVWAVVVVAWFKPANLAHHKKSVV